MEQRINIWELIMMAEQMGLPCIERKEVLTIVGEQQTFEFKIVEERQCQGQIY